MPFQVYVVNDPLAISFLINDDINGFKEYLEADEYLIFDSTEVFDTEEEAIAFCAGIGYDTSESAIPERYPLRSFEETDLPFIEMIENY